MPDPRETAPEPPAFAGTARFHVLRKLGAGGMGVVYEALDRETGNRVALKTLRTWSADAFLRFKNEFRALQDLRHPNLIHLGELLEESGQWFFTMELIEGGVPFLQWVRHQPTDDVASSSDSTPILRPPETYTEDDPTEDIPRSGRASGPLPLQLAGPLGIDEQRLRAALAQLALGLAALHRAQKVHRDIKPSNILVTPAGRVIVLDFGLVTDAAGHEQWIDDHLVGTASYMAPEQAAGPAVGPEADWYSVGVVLYQALTGRLPFHAAPEAVLVMKQAIEASPPALLVPEIPGDLNKLCVDLLRIDPKQRPTAKDLLRRLDAAEAPADTALATDEFVGRSDELAALADAFAASRSGTAVTLLVHGESGVGKSTLARRFAERLQAGTRGTVLFAGRCYERESVPYKAVDGIVDALSQYLTSLDDSDVRELLPPEAALIAQIFPVLRRVAAIAQAPRPELGRMEPQELRTRVFSSLRDLLSRVAARHPLLLLIDDLQWADADSLALLGEALRPPLAPPLLLIATVRTAEVAAVDALAARLPGRVQKLHIGALPPDDARTLVERLARTVGADLSAEAIAREAGGHPLFIDELIRARLAAGSSPTAAAGPLRLEEALWARVGRLDPVARRLLEFVAVAATPVAQETCAHAAESDFGTFADQISLLRSANLVKTSGARRSDAVEPYHDRVRDAVLEHLAPDRRRSCHQRLALAFEAAPTADPETLSIHWHGAGDDQKAALHATRAAAQSAEALAFDRAARLYRRALDLQTVDHTEQNTADRAALQARLGDALANAGRGAEAADAYLAAVPAAPDPLDLQRRAAEQLLRSGHIDRGLSVLGAVLTAVGTSLPRSPQRALASLLFSRARVRLRGLGYRPRPAASLPAADLARIDAYWSVAEGLGIVDTIRGADFQSRGLLLALRAGEPFRLARAFALEADFSAAAGGASRARTARLLESANEAARRADDPAAHAFIASAAGLAAFLEGRFRAARELMDTAVDLLQRCTGVAWEMHISHLYALISLSYLGETTELSRRLPIRLREAEERGNLYAATTLRTTLANLAWLAEDDVPRARAELATAARDWSRQGFHLQHYWNLFTAAQIDLYTGDPLSAWRRVTEAWPALSRSLLLRIQVVRIEALHLRARAALAAAVAGAPDPKRLLAQAEKDARSIAAEKMPWSTPLALLLQAGLASARHQDPLPHLQQSAPLFEAADMSLYASCSRHLSSPTTPFTHQNIKNPSRLLSLLSPGFGG